MWYIDRLIVHMYFTLTTFIDFCFVNQMYTWWLCCSTASWSTILEIICINSSPLFWRKKTHWGNQWACSTQGLSSVSQLVNPPPQWKHRTKSLVPKHINSYFTIYVVTYTCISYNNPHILSTIDFKLLSVKYFNLVGSGYMFFPEPQIYSHKTKIKIGKFSSIFLV